MIRKEGAIRLVKGARPIYTSRCPARRHGDRVIERSKACGRSSATSALASTMVRNQTSSAGGFVAESSEMMRHLADSDAFSHALRLTHPEPATRTACPRFTCVCSFGLVVVFSLALCVR